MGGESGPVVRSLGVVACVPAVRRAGFSPGGRKEGRSPEGCGGLLFHRAPLLLSPATRATSAASESPELAAAFLKAAFRWDRPRWPRLQP